MKKNDIKTIIIVAIINIIIFSLVIIIGKISNNEDETQEKLHQLEDFNYFFSIENAINDIPNYIIEADPNSLYGILSKNYISNNDITIDNVLEKFNNFSNTSLEIIESYEISKGSLYKFFVKTDIRNNSFEEISNIIGNKYMMINYNDKNMTYNIEIISKEQYDAYISEKLKFNFEKVENNGYNELEYKNIADSTIATYYLNNFINQIYENTTEAYKSISIKTKNEYFNTYNNFISFINHNNDMINNIKISSYNIFGKNCYCVDNYGNEYQFIFENVNDYIVNIYFKEYIHTN